MVKVERRPFFYRAVFEDYVEDDRGPLPSRSGKGRYHDPGSGPTTYLAEHPETAWREVTYRWGADPDAYRMVEVDATISRVADLTDPAFRRTYGVEVATRVGDNHEPCRRLATRLVAEGFEALRAFSKADSPQGRQLVVFLSRLRPGSYLRVVNVHRIKEIISLD